MKLWVIGMHTESKRLRRKRGASIALGTVIALVLIVVCLAVFFAFMYFGGQRETRNASDSGALNVARQVVTGVSVNPNSPDEAQFYDVLDNGVNVNLRDINRVWAKAMLCALNAHAMGEGQENVQKLYDAANDMTDRLVKKLDDPNTLKSWYLEFAQANSTRMLGPNSSLDAPDLSGWSQSYLDAESESNISITASQLPLENDIPITMVQNSKDTQNKYLAGYHPYSIDGVDYWQVPFDFGERPHLVSATNFQTQNQNPPAWDPKPVPNAFSMVGMTKNNARLGETTASWVETNPQQTFQAAIPAGFIRIKLDANTLEWKPNFLTYYTESYGFTPTDFESAPIPVGCGIMYADETVGDEYLPPTLYMALSRFLQGVDQSTAFQHLYQRVQEMNPSVTKSSLISQLQLTPLYSTDPGPQEYIIWNCPDISLTPPRYGPNTGKWKLMITPASLAPPWIDGDPDGTPNVIETEDLWTPDCPNYGTFTVAGLSCFPTGEYPTLTNLLVEKTWQPGTGYGTGTLGLGDCLGTLEIHRTTKVYYFGICTCI